MLEPKKREARNQKGESGMMNNTDMTFIATQSFKGYKARYDGKCMTINRECMTELLGEYTMLGGIPVFLDGKKQKGEWIRSAEEDQNGEYTIYPYSPTYGIKIS